MPGKPCRRCYWFKRRTDLTGTCWLRAEVYPAQQASTHPDATCDGWLAKAERVKA